MNFFKYINNKKGITLMEIVVTLALFSLVMVIIFPMTKVSSYALKEGQTELNQRSDIRNASEFLTDDVKYSKEIISATTGTLELTDKNDIVVKYYIDASDGYLKREVDGKVVQEFKDIMQADFQLENDNLVKTSFNKMTLPDDTEPKGQLEELKIARLNGKATGIDKLFTEGDFVANNFKIDGQSFISGPDAKVIIQDSCDFGNGIAGKNIVGYRTFIDSKEIHINGDINLKGNQLGNRDNPGVINIKGNVELEFGNPGETSNILHGDLHMEGNLNLEHYGELHDVGVKGDVNFGNSSDSFNFDSPIRYNGNINYNGLTPSPTPVFDSSIDDVVIPQVETDEVLPTYRSDQWYIDNGYSHIASNTLNDYARGYIIGDYTFESSYHGSRTIFEDVRIVSNGGDITIGGDYTVKGILFAPEGTITIKQGASVEGVMIAKNVIINGSGGMESKGLVYCPGTLGSSDGVVRIENSGLLTGAVIANIIDVSGGSMFKFDDPDDNYIKNNYGNEVPWEEATP